MTASPEAKMLHIVGPLWSAERTRDALGLTEAELEVRRTAGAVLGVQLSDQSWVYPLNQFETRDGVVRVRPALVEFFTVLRD